MTGFPEGLKRFHKEGFRGNWNIMKGVKL